MLLSFRYGKWRGTYTYRLYGSMFIQLCTTSRCNYLTYNTSLYTREEQWKETIRQTRRDRHRKLQNEKKNIEKKIARCSNSTKECRTKGHPLSDATSICLVRLGVTCAYWHTFPLNWDALLSVWRTALKKRKKEWEKEQERNEEAEREKEHIHIWST